MHPASRPGPGDPGNGSAGRWGRRDCVDGMEKPWDWTSLSEVVKSPGWPGGTVELRSPTSPLAYNDGSDLDAPAGYLKAPCSVNAALSREKKHQHLSHRSRPNGRAEAPGFCVRHQSDGFLLQGTRCPLWEQRAAGNEQDHIWGLFSETEVPVR